MSQTYDIKRPNKKIFCIDSLLASLQQILRDILDSSRNQERTRHTWTSLWSIKCRKHKILCVRGPLSKNYYLGINCTHITIRTLIPRYEKNPLTAGNRKIWKLLWKASEAKQDASVEGRLQQHGPSRSSDQALSWSSWLHTPSRDILNIGIFLKLLNVWGSFFTSWYPVFSWNEEKCSWFFFLINIELTSKASPAIVQEEFCTEGKFCVLPTKWQAQAVPSVRPPVITSHFFCAHWSFSSLQGFVFSKADVQMEIQVTSPLRTRPLTHITPLLTAGEVWISWHFTPATNVGVVTIWVSIRERRDPLDINQLYLTGKVQIHIMTQDMY